MPISKFLHSEFFTCPEQSRRILNSKKGFTLIELLVAIAIIGMVFGVVVGSTSQIQKSSRDAKRQSDLRSIQSGLQQYYADRSYYPNNLSIDSISSLTINSDSSVTPITPVKTYIKIIPKDPNASAKYCYIPFKSINSSGTTSDCNNSDANPSNRCYYYKLIAEMEKGGSTPLGETYCGVSSYNFQLDPT